MEYVLDASWKDVNHLVVYGFGKAAHGNLDSFMSEFDISVIIDNNPKFKGQTYRNVEIIDFETYLKKRNAREKIVLLVAGKARRSVKTMLQDAGFIENIDYTDMEVFASEWFYRFRQEVRFAKIGVSITNYCTFNCEGCNMLMPYYKKPKHYDIRSIEEDFDEFFRMVDYVNLVSIIGGEPLLHPNVSELLEYLGRNYRKKIGKIQLITNGSIVPKRKLLEVILKYNVEIRISDYTTTVSYEKKLDEVRRTFKEFGITYLEFKQTEWIDFGYPEGKVDMGQTPEEIRSHMKKCQGVCWWLADKKVYFCSNAWSAQEVGLTKLKVDQDYIDLRRLNKDNENDREELYAFYLGDMKEGYMTHCKRCRGFHCTMTIPAGVQRER